MPVIARKRPLVVLLAACILIFGCVILVIFRNNMEWASNLFTWVLLANDLLMLVLVLKRIKSSFHLKPHWILVASATVIGALTALVSIFSTHTHVPGAELPNLLMACGYVPAFLIISLPAGRHYFRQFLWIDTAQSIFAVYLFYIVLFQSRPFSHDQPGSIGAVLLIVIYLSFDLSVLGGSFLHIFAAPDKDEMRFFRYYFLAELIGLAGDVIHNVIILHSPGQTLTGLPVLFANFAVLLLLLYLPPETSSDRPIHADSFLADLINLASPSLPSAMLLALGIVVQQRFHRIGIAAIITAFVLFVIRATFYQKSFERNQLHLEMARDHMERLSNLDELTGVANRRAFQATLESEWEHSIRSGSPLSLLLIDIDHFKELNDTAGHQAGDECLATVAQTLSANLQRSIDVVGRYGGDEFAVILPSTDHNAAEFIAEKLCVCIREMLIQHPVADIGFVTISLGVSTCSHFHEHTWKSLLAAADSALYQAKAAGRNCWRSYFANAEGFDGSSIRISPQHES